MLEQNHAKYVFVPNFSAQSHVETGPKRGWFYADSTGRLLKTPSVILDPNHLSNNTATNIDALKCAIRRLLRGQVHLIGAFLNGRIVQLRAELDTVQGPCNARIMRNARNRISRFR
jgi:hypothetical protein